LGFPPSAQRRCLLRRRRPEPLRLEHLGSREEPPATVLPARAVGTPVCPDARQGSSSGLQGPTGGAPHALLLSFLPSSFHGSVVPPPWRWRSVPRAGLRLQRRPIATGRQVPA